MIVYFKKNNQIYDILIRPSHPIKYLDVSTYTKNTDEEQVLYLVLRKNAT